ncbi:leishmanolysin-related zinc metalloendopeptidase [Candidatus Palauibacter sp.]|uniref:leishmanolysin-related zinc metalloendopeptidase n=1 Tax=Candidatus Palauibacter sp. TaxID=3101350 RepID=UPI003AF2AD48
MKTKAPCAPVILAVALAAACDDAPTTPTAAPERPPAVVTLTSESAAAREGETVGLRIEVNPAGTSAISIAYTIGIDTDPGTADADASDYEIGERGTIEIEAGAAEGTLEIPIADDTSTEPTREVFVVTLEPGAEPGAYRLGPRRSASVTIEEGVCDRWDRVRDDIVGQSPVRDCAEVTDLHLASITELDLSDSFGETGISIQAGDFAGLTRLKVLQLQENRLERLPEGVFAGLSSLESLDLTYTGLGALPARLFAGLSNLRELRLPENRVENLPAGIFSDLSGLRVLDLADNALAALPPTVFRSLGQLEVLWLDANRLAKLPEGVFSDLSRLRSLALGYNNLSGLPPGIFTGLSRLEELFLQENAGAPFVLRPELERVDNPDPLAPGPARVAATVVEGLPFEISFGLTAYDGALSSEAVTFAAGTGVSGEVTVTRSGEDAGATHVSVSAPPALPPGFLGLVLAPGDPIVLFAADANRPPLAERSIPPHRLQAGAREVAVTNALYFRDPDGDSLAYTAASGDVGVVSTGADGERITLEPAGPGTATVTVTATDGAGLGVSQSFAVEVRDRVPGAFEIDIVPMDAGAESLSPRLRDAAGHWMDVLRESELPNVPVPENTELACTSLTLDARMGEVDDLTVLVSVRSVDGPGGTLGYAATCWLRAESLLPVLAAIHIDADDVERLGEEDANAVILHEFGHALGIGPSWEELGLLRWTSSPGIPVDLYFAGPLAIAAFDSAGGTDYEYAKVPVEIRGGLGSVDSHWRESVLGPELMTSRLNRGAEHPLSAVTIWSLADLGYTVDASLADEYALPGTGGEAADVPKRQRARSLDLTGDILSPPLLILDRDGRVVRRVTRN